MTKGIELTPAFASGHVPRRHALLCSLLILATLSLVSPPSAHTATLRDLGPDHMLQQWTVEDGIPGSQALCLAQSTDGYIWLGTYYGIARFDGLRFTSFDATMPGIPHGGCFQIIPGPNGSLYCRFRQQVVLYENGTFTTLNLAEQITSPIFLLQTTPTNSVYLASRGDTANTINVSEVNRNGIQQRIAIPTSLNVRRTALEMCRDRKSQYWLRVGNLIGLVSNGQWQTESSPPTEDTRVRGPLASRDGGIWIVRDRRIQRWQNNTWVGPEIQVPTESNNINRIIESPSGDLWVLAPVGNVFFYRREERGAKFTLQNRIKTPSKTGTLVDHEGNHWFSGGTFLSLDASGLFRIHERVFRHMNGISGVPAATRAFAQLTPDRMIVAANSGVYETSGNLLTSAEHSKQAYRRLVRKRHWSVATLGSDRLLTARYQVSRKEQASGESSINRVQPSTSPSTIQPVPFTADSAKGSTAILADRNGSIWVADRFQNLIRIDQDQTTFFDRPESPLGFKAYSLACDTENTLWIGTFEHGLVRYRDGQFHKFAQDQDRLKYSVRALYFDQEGTLWLATSGRGLVRFRDNSFREYTTAQGLPTNELNTIVDDHLGHLWFGSYNGVHRVSKAQLEQLPVDRPELLSVRSFGLAEGLSSLQCSSGHPASIRALDGRLWFATIAGANIVNPSNIKTTPTPTPPKMILETIYLDGVPHSLQDSQSEHFRNGRYTFSSRIERIEFHYTAISFGAPDQVRFRYRLPPFINDWQEAGLNRQVVIPQLKPGEYQFEVTAANPDGIWSKEPKTIRFEVLGRWWERTASQALMFGAGLALLFTGFALRSARLRRRQETQEQFTRDLLEHQETDRKRIAQELHDSLEQNLLVIKNRANLPQDATSPNRERQALQEISDISAESIEEVRAIANNLRPYQIDRLGLSKAIQAMLNQIDGSTDLTVQHEIEPVPDQLSAEQQINLYRIIQEALNNVLKHAQATQVTVTLIVSERHLSLRVKDNGIGFDPKPATQQHRQGFGVNGIIERVSMIGGTCELKSAPGSGTTWTIRFNKPEKE